MSIQKSYLLVAFEKEEKGPKLIESDITNFAKQSKALKHLFESVLSQINRKCRLAKWHLNGHIPMSSIGSM